MDVEAFLKEIRALPHYEGQDVYVRRIAPRDVRYAPEGELAMAERVSRWLGEKGIARLYTHQAEAIRCARAGRDPLIATGTASGKSLCYTVPLLETLLAEPDSTALLLFPTKALSQDQFQRFQEALTATGLTGEKRSILAGVFDGDTPSTLRRRLRDHGGVLFTNPDMLHAGVLPQHARWARFFANLKFLIIDELHVYSGIFGSNAANLFTRLFRLCKHYGSSPRLIASSATIGNPLEMAEELTGRKMTLIDDDGSPRGPRTYVFWNPPRIRGRDWRSRRSANDEAHELMALLVQRGVPTITFSKARITAEMIHRYVCDSLRTRAPQLVSKVTPYRGGYLPQERREIEKRLFEGELLGVSTTPALELGIDVGGMDASILVGYPGTLASFFQQSGRAGRQEREAVVFLIGLDTAVNQYIMGTPDYLFGRPVEDGVLDSENPFVILGQLRCAAHELPLREEETDAFGPHAPLVLRVLADNRKLQHIGHAWYHAAPETPQHEVSLRDTSGANVTIEDVDTGAILGEVDVLDAPPLLHPEAIYIHRGDTYRVIRLDLEKNVASVRRENVDYYTQALGGTDIHHIDAPLREKPFGTGKAFWGEVTAYCGTWMFERIHFYQLDPISRHGLDLPTYALETMAFWLVPTEKLMNDVRQSGLDTHQGLRGIGYALRMLLPLFMTCDTRDLSHSVGSVNSPWNAIFVFERYPHGLGFTEKAYHLLHRIVPAVREHIGNCPCEDGCPCCVGKPLRQFTTWNVERGEANIPSKKAALMILDGLLGDGSSIEETESGTAVETPEGEAQRLERALRRRLERMGEPKVFHPITPNPVTEYPDPAPTQDLPKADSDRRAREKADFARQLRKKLAKNLEPGGLDPTKRKPPGPSRLHVKHSIKPPTYFPGKPDVAEDRASEPFPRKKEEVEIKASTEPSGEDLLKAPCGTGAPVGASFPTTPEPEKKRSEQEPIQAGDPLAARAAKLRKKKT